LTNPLLYQDGYRPFSCQTGPISNSAISLDRDDDKFTVVNRLSPLPNILPIWNRFKPSVHVLGRFLFQRGRKRLYPIAKTLVVTASLLSDVTSALIDRIASVGGLFHAVADQFEDNLNGSTKT